MTLNIKIRKVGLAFIVLSFLTLFIFLYSFQPKIKKKEPEISSNDKVYSVIHVLDGDTIIIESGEQVRYIGIDTPELLSENTEEQCFGYESYLLNKIIMQGTEVRLEKDVSEVDMYGRLLRYVYIDDIFLNDYLVRNGFAKASDWPPDTKYKEQFEEAEEEAKERKRGMWGNTCDEWEPISNLNILNQ
jgi:micrococcal nuclease